MKKTIGGLIGAALVLVIGLYASGWAPRHTQTMRGRVVGHWAVTEQAKVGLDARAKSYYFGPIQQETSTGRFIRVGADGVQEQGRWEVASSEPDKDRLRVSFQFMGKTRLNTIRISDDAQRMELGGPIGMFDAFSSELRYVDAETSPAAVDVREITERLEQFTGP